MTQQMDRLTQRTPQTTHPLQEPSPAPSDGLSTDFSSRPFIEEPSPFPRKPSGESHVSNTPPPIRMGGLGWAVTGVGAAMLTALIVIATTVSLLRLAPPAQAPSSLTTSTTSASTSNASTVSMPDMNTSASSSTSAGSTAGAMTHQPYNAQLPAAPTGKDAFIKLVMKEVLLPIAPGVVYHAWTFNGTVPGPTLHVRQGQTVHVTLMNEGSMPHSIDFHAAQTPWNVNYQEIAPGKSFSFTWQATYPGVFMYHCGSPTVIYHIANGMYGTIIVDPTNGWSPAQDYVLVQSEFYTSRLDDGTYMVDPNKLMSAVPDYVVFNGYVNQYKDAPLTAKAGQRIRLFLVNAGPSQFSAFHVIGAIFSDSYADGNPANHEVGNQTVIVPPGGGMVVELTIPQAGLYPFVTHSFADASKGAMGILKVTA